MSMLLKFKNEHIFYALEPVWNNSDFDYEFKTQINQLVVANFEKDFVQEVQITPEVLLKIYKADSLQPEGMAAAINKEIKDALIPQIAAVSNMAEVINNQAVPNEAASIQIAINDLDLADISARTAIILKGKNKILA